LSRSIHHSQLNKCDNKRNNNEEMEPTTALQVVDEREKEILQNPDVAVSAQCLSFFEECDRSRTIPGSSRLHE
ncbi:hypothetical protein PFISCL1PPCAC_23273, partial [Pristionchus fissidentatus]